MTVNTGSRLHPRYEQERSMRIKSDLKREFIEKNTHVFKMDCGTDMMHGTKDLTLIQVGLKKDFFVHATQSINIKVGCKKDSVTNATKSIKIKIGWKKNFFVIKHADFRRQ